MNTTRRKHTVVIGTSAGGVDALGRLIAQLPANFPAPILVVQHMAADATASALLQAMQKGGNFDCSLAKDGEALEPGHIYVAPPDHHLLLNRNTAVVRKGARENRSRPAIDPLFRSAAVAHGSRVIAVLLTGRLDDGTSGIQAVKQCGGTTIVQEPGDAEYSDMPQSALNNVKIDYCVPLQEMGALLDRLVREPVRAPKPIPADVKSEAEIAERVVSDVAAVNALGDQVPFNCPNCGGVLWKMKSSKTLRFRCHTGHAYTASALLTTQSEKIEETLWICLRMLEERRNLLTTMQTPGKSGAKSASERAKETDVHITRIRQILTADSKATPEDISPAA